MTTMLEKAARAAEAVVEYRPDEPAGELAGPDTVANWPAVIRAALQAIRGPFDAYEHYHFTEAGAIAASHTDEWRVDPVMLYEDCDNLFRAEWRAEASAAFTAMIDAILDETAAGERNESGT